MKNSAKQSKNVIAKANTIETKQSVNAEENRLTEINLSKFADQLQSVELKVKREKETLYKYPDGFSKEDINSDKGKKFRNSLRTKLKSFSNNIFYYAKTQDAEKIKLEIEKFDLFYQANYRINDYTINSITHAEKREKDIELMLMIIKEVKSA
jgi:hypothetical protein